MNLSASIERNKQTDLRANNRTNPIEETFKLSSKIKTNSTVISTINQPITTMIPLNNVKITDIKADKTNIFQIRKKNTQEKPLKINKITYSAKELLDEQGKTNKNSKLINFMKKETESYYKEKHGFLREEEERELANNRKKDELFEPFRKNEEKVSFGVLFEKSKENFEKHEKLQINDEKDDKFEKCDKNKPISFDFQKPQFSFEKPLNFIEKHKVYNEEMQKVHKKTFKKQLIQPPKQEFFAIKSEKNTKEIIENFKKKQKIQKTENSKGKKLKKISKSKKLPKNSKEEIGDFCDKKEENLLIENERIKSSKNTNNCSNILVNFQ